VTPGPQSPSAPALPAELGGGGGLQSLLGFLLGTGFTLALFLGVAHFDQVTPTAPPAEIEDLRTVAMPFEPPPPPPQNPGSEEAVEAEITSVTGFDFEPSDSPVKIAVSPPTLDLLNSVNQVAPPAVIQIGRLVGEFKPRLDLFADPHHVFQENEVDRIPAVLYRQPPSIPSRYTKDGRSLRVTLLLLIDADGAVADVRVLKSSGESEVDDLVVENVKTWGFSPAIKRGRKVRCLLQQPYIFVPPHHSPFHV